MQLRFFNNSILRPWWARLVFALLALLLSSAAGAANCSTKGNGGGEWRSSSTWTCSGSPGSSDTVTILSGDTVSITRSASAGSITINSGGVLEIGQAGRRNSYSLTVTSDMSVAGTFQVADTSAGNHTVDVNGSLSILSGGQFSQQDVSGWGLTDVFVHTDFSNAGTYAVGINGPDLIIDGNATNSGSLDGGSDSASNVMVGGDFSNTSSGSINTDAATLTFDGSSAQTVNIAGSATLNKLAFNNTSGVTLGTSVTAGQVTLTAGPVTTGSNMLIVTGNCSTASAGTQAGYVIGYLRLTFPSGSSTCTFRIGSSTGYAPVTLAVTAGSGGTLTASTTGNEHPQIASSEIDANKDANRYWTLGATGDTLAANVSSYGPTLNFNSGDLDSSATAGSFGMAKYSGGTWTNISSVTAASTSATASGISGPIVISTDFAVGEAAATCPVPSGLPSNMTCVCDNFGRASLNPSTIYGGNWSLSTSGGTFGVPKIVNSGYLRMTDNSTGDATAATMPGVFPAAGNLIQIEFKHYAYSGGGADGVALTLSDASIAPVPGAFGGSLGYAQKSNPGSDCTVAGGCPGFAGGWIGVALDEYGGYSSNTEGRSGGSAPGPTPDAVAIRGSGSGQTGYPYLAGTGSLSPGIDNPGSATPANGYLYRIKVDARNYTSTNKTTTVSVDRDTTGTGNSYSSVIAPFDAFAANSSQAAVPTNWKLSFTGSTGSITNIHEIGGLKICAQTITPPAGYRIQVDNLTPSTCSTPGGSPASPVVTVTALDSNGNAVTTYDKTITLSATLSGGGASNATWSLKSGSGLFSGNQYTFASADQGTAQFYLSDTSTQDLYITVSENGGTLSSSTPSTQPVQFSGGTFLVASSDSLGDGVVAGRGHALKITRTTCSGGTNSTDTSYTGTKSLDGWYIPDSDHPNGAIAPQICALNASNTCLPSPGACQTISIAAPNLSSSSNNISLPFSNGVANFCLGTSDVGKYSVFLRDDSNINAAVTGSSNVFTVRPFAIAVSNVATSAGVNNPATSSPAPSASSAVFTTAGANFSAKVSGYIWNSAGDGNGDGWPDSGDNWSQITGGGIASHYADTVNLSAGTPFAPATVSDTPAGTGVAGSLSGGNVAITGGSNTQLTLSYSEVGSFSLHAQPSTAYLNSSGTYKADLTNRVAIFANPSLSTQSTWVGRFKPDHFTFSGTSSIVTRSDIGSGAGCSPTQSSFSYMDEPMRLNFSLQAVNAGGTVTQNYSGSYAHLSPGAADWVSYGAGNSMGLWMLGDNYSAGGGTCKAVFSTGTTTSFQSCTGTTPASVTRAAGQRVALSGTPTSGGWSAGVASFSADVMLQRADTADGPYDSLKIGIAPQDLEGVTFSSYNLDTDNNGTSERQSLGSTAVRYGRLIVPSMYGSELLPMPIKLQAQYWNGSAYVNNTDDSCTPLSSSNFALSNPVGGITSTGMVAIQGSGSLAAGLGTLTLSKPSPTLTSKGTVTLSPTSTLSSYLPGSGVEAFGVYRSGRVIYLREGHY